MVSWKRYSCFYFLFKNKLFLCYFCFSVILLFFKLIQIFGVNQYSCVLCAYIKWRKPESLVPVLLCQVKVQVLGFTLQDLQG